MSGVATLLPSYAMADTNVKGNYESFDADTYVAMRYKDVTNDRVHFLMGSFHEAFQSLPYSLTVLEYGSGPVIQHCISAAAHASEIVFSDIAESNREAVRKWLRRDPTAFNWSPHFDHVVQTLEGKGEKEAREREEMLRKVVKGVVHCDVLADPPIEKGFEGPYDVLIEGGCLLVACTTTESFKKGLITLTHLLKTGGTILMWGMDRDMKQSTTVYSVGSNVYQCLCMEKEIVLEAVKEAGFSNVHMQSREYVPSKKTSKQYVYQPGVRGFYFIQAKKSIS